MLKLIKIALKLHTDICNIVLGQHNLFSATFLREEYTLKLISLAGASHSAIEKIASSW